MPSGTQLKNNQIAAAPASADRAQKYLDYIDTSLARHTQLHPLRAAHNDYLFMQKLTDQANARYPGLNLKFTNSARTLGADIKSQMTRGIESARFIISTYAEPHFAALDVRVMNGRVSVLGVEPAGADYENPALLGFQITRAFEQQNLPSRLTILQCNMQRSDGECGMFSLSFAKNMLRETPHFNRLHDMNLKNQFIKDGNIFMTREQSLVHLPATFARHAQSRSWLNEYLSLNPAAAQSIINHKNETLLDRFNRNVIVGSNGKTYSNSIEQKRRKEIGHLF